MTTRVSPILDQNGQPFVHMNGKPRHDLLKAFQKVRMDQEQVGRKKIAATYDAARTTPEYANYWAYADRYDADSANSRGVREVMVPRSRYESGNNGYSDGIGQTYATDVVGTGPKLRMQTGSKGFNQLIEFQFALWQKAIGFRRKLWCSAHAKHQDGEGVGVLRTNPNVNHAVKLDWVLYETEQCQTPLLMVGEQGYIDGIKFDQYGNPESYDVLPQHPGAIGFHAMFDLVPEKVPARFVTHWYKMKRPNQHRGLPEMGSTLNLGAAFRRLREANLSTAEKIATWTLFLKTLFQPDADDVDVSPPSFDQIELVRGMITALPNTVEPFQLKAEHPGPEYETFHGSLLSEQARPKSMPRNKAGCDSSQYNYASGRLDHQTYYSALDVDRADGDDYVLDVAFDVWFEEAVRVFGWLGGNPSAIGPAARVHGWDWPKHRVADVEAEANANDRRLRNGSLSISKHYSDNGEDFEDEVLKMSSDFGVSSEEMRKVLLHELYPVGAAAVLSPAQPATTAATDSVSAALLREVRTLQGSFDRFTRSNS